MGLVRLVSSHEARRRRRRRRDQSQRLNYYDMVGCASETSSQHPSENLYHSGLPKLGVGGGRERIGDMGFGEVAIGPVGRKLRNVSNA